MCCRLRCSTKSGGSNTNPHRVYGKDGEVYVSAFLWRHQTI